MRLRILAVFSSLILPSLAKADWGGNWHRCQEVTVECCPAPQSCQPVHSSMQWTPPSPAISPTQWGWYVDEYGRKIWIPIEPTKTAKTTTSSLEGRVEQLEDAVRALQLKLSEQATSEPEATE